MARPHQPRIRLRTEVRIRSSILWLEDAGSEAGVLISRACPGRALGERNVWLVLARLVATMDVGKEVGQDGQEITPVLTYRSGIVKYVDSFLCGTLGTNRLILEFCTATRMNSRADCRRAPRRLDNLSSNATLICDARMIASATSCFLSNE